MAKVEYCVTEFTPNENQVGMSHSWSAKCVINYDRGRVSVTNTPSGGGETIPGGNG